MRFKKVLSVFCVVTFLFTIAFAQVPGKPMENYSEMTVSAYLKNQQGEVIEVVGTPVALQQNRGMEPGEKYSTFAFDVIVPRANHSHTVDDTDDSASVRAYLNVGYKTDDSTPTNFLLTSVSGGYTILDQQVRVDEARLSYVCNGVFPSPGTSSQIVLDRVVGSSFSYNTGFTQYVSSYGGLIGGKVNLDLARGTSNYWDFEVSFKFADVPW